MCPAHAGSTVSVPCLKQLCLPAPPPPALSAATLTSLPFLFISSWLRVFFVHMASAGKGLPGWGPLPLSPRIPGWTFPSLSVDQSRRTLSAWKINFAKGGRTISQLQVGAEQRQARPPENMPRLHSDRAGVKAWLLHLKRGVSVSKLCNPFEAWLSPL